MNLINKNVNKSKICLVVPIFNNENSIKLLYNTFKEIVNNKIKINYKLILVDDNRTIPIASFLSKQIISRTKSGFSVLKTNSKSLSIFLSHTKCFHLFF